MAAELAKREVECPEMNENEMHYEFSISEAELRDRVGKTGGCMSNGIGTALHRFRQSLPVFLHLRRFHEWCTAIYSHQALHACGFQYLKDK